MSDTEKQQAEEIAELRRRLANAESERDRHHRQEHELSRDMERLKDVFVELMARMCQRD